MMCNRRVTQSVEGRGEGEGEGEKCKGTRVGTEVGRLREATQMKAGPTACQRKLKLRVLIINRKPEKM